MAQHLRPQRRATSFATPLDLGARALRSTTSPLRVATLATIAFAGAPALLAPPVAARTLPIAGERRDDPELDAKLAAAGKDVAKLLEIAAACTTAGQDDAARRVWKRVLELDAQNELAHKGLRHQLYDGKWFESFAELTKFKRDEAARMKAKGLARFKDEWVPEADVPFLAMGWTKESDGWVDPVVKARAKEIEERRAAGFQFRADDNSWIAPSDNEKWAALLWKCGDEWLDLAKANEYHAKFEHPWELVGDHYEVWTTCDWDAGNLARWHAEKAHAELVRLFGVEPRSRTHFVVLNGLEQYNQVAAGASPVLPDTEGFSSLHGAYFADVVFDASTKPARYDGCGVSFWNRKDEKLKGWGPYWLRWAAAQSFVDAIDPSWTTVAESIASGASPDPAAFGAAFWKEKKIPRWLRYGAASYVERFMKDPEAAPGADPWTLRAFAFAELKKAGGLRKLDDVFAFALDVKDIPGSSRLYQEAGLLVAFLLDGAPANKELAEKLAAFRAALKSGTRADATQAAVALQRSLAKCERDVKKFAGL